MWIVIELAVRPYERIGAQLLAPLARNQDLALGNNRSREIQYNGRRIGDRYSHAIGCS